MTDWGRLIRHPKDRVFLGLPPDEEEAIVAGLFPRSVKRSRPYPPQPVAKESPPPPVPVVAVATVKASPSQLARKAAWALAHPPKPVPEPKLPKPRKGRTRRNVRRKPYGPRSVDHRCSTIPGIESLALDPCAYCWQGVPKGHDHIIPISKGGEHSLDNVVRVCWECNKAKNTQKLVVFLARRQAKWLTK